MSPDNKKPKQKSGALLALIMVIVYVVVLAGTLKYTGVIKFPAEKKAKVANESTDKKNKSRPTTTVKAAETGTKATTTLPPATPTTSQTTTTSTTVRPKSDRPKSEEPSSDDKLRKLVKIYESMDSAQAAQIISKLSDSEAVALLGKMDEEVAAEVLAAMDVDRAAILSRKLGL